MRNILSLLFMICVVACNLERKPADNNSFTQSGIKIDSDYGGSCPHLYRAVDSSLVISWLRDVSDTQAVLCYAIAKNGLDFGPVIQVPGSDNVHPHPENLPRVIKTKDGKILAAWGASSPNPDNPYAGIVYYSWSLDGGKNWTTPKTLSRDLKSIDQRYFDIEILHDNRVAMIWLDSRKDTKAEGSSLYFATFNDQLELENERPIDKTCCQCCRTDLFVDRQGNLHTVYRKIINDSIRDMVHSVSIDHGQHFSEPQRISPDHWVINGCPHTGPAITQTTEGLSFVWYTLGNGSGVYYANSTNNGKSFSPKDAVSSQAAAKHPQLAVNNTGKLAIVWDEGTANGSRIGLEFRNAAGEKLAKHYLTDSIGYASFPVIRAMNKGFVVAYTAKQRADDVEKVFYKLVNPE